MRCISPIKAGFNRSGDITYSIKQFSKELASFEFPCRKCLPCRLQTAREKAIRAVHESTMYENNIFLTLTYNNENLGDGRLHYLDFQLFMKSLRKKYPHTKISYMVTGEYGDQLKRPHWHAIIFNYRPTDSEYHYTTDLGEQVFTSQELTKIWKRGNIEFGSVTIDSAGYVARYAAKKLTHGKDQDHDYHPIHKTSSKHAIGKRWLEKYYKTDCFNLGFIRLPNGEKAAIPRYYTEWLKKNDMPYYTQYASTIKVETTKLAEQNSINEKIEDLNNWSESNGKSTSRQGIKLTILKQKFKLLQERLKL